jgi:pSer/pThr/pTyr-binding forkhead associated (FHA) protein
VPDKPDFWCVDFDSDWREAPVYYDTQQYCYQYQVGTFWDPNDVYHKGLSTSGNGLLTYGYPCNVEVPYFKNNQFRQLTLCGMFLWANWYGSIEMGLVYNGYAWECAPGSIRVNKNTNDQIEASITTQFGGTTTIVHPNQVNSVIFTVSNTVVQVHF